MGNRTHRASRFLARNLLTGGLRTAQFLMNTGKSVATGLKAGAKDVPDLEIFEVPKPQATRKTAK